MQKKIIALAVASALVAPAAFADTSNVNVYGVANVSYDMVTTKFNNAAGVAGGTSTGKVSSNTSRIGLKGSEDLGDGLSAIWQVESLINIDNAGNTTAGGAGATVSGNVLGGRNTFAGLSSANMGTVIMGRHDTPYNISTRKLDVFGDGIADNRSLMGGTAGKNVAGSFDGRQPDVIAYISPAISGFTGAIAYLNLAEDANVTTRSKASAWSLAGMYSMDAFYGSLAYEVHDIGAGTLSPSIAPVVTALVPGAIALTTAAKESSVKFGFGYTQDAIAVGFAYEKTSDNLNAGANLLGHSAYYLSGKYSFGNDAVKAAYTKVGSGAAVNTGASQFSLGYDHSLSKRTTVYALYTALKSDSAANFGLSANGTGGANTAIGLGNAPSAMSFGMKHTF